MPKLKRFCLYVNAATPLNSCRKCNNKKYEDAKKIRIIIDYFDLLYYVKDFFRTIRQTIKHLKGRSTPMFS